eukprot:PhM_4_TR17448/c2_g1_i1/m.88780
MFSEALVDHLTGRNSAGDYDIPSRGDMNPQGRERQYSIVTSTVENRKPPRPLVADASKRTPIQSTSELELSSWHVGRYIEGVISSFSNRYGFMNHNICICCRHCCDGTLFTVFVACAHPDDMHAMLGKKVRINDPYYRVDVSGRRTIRVDSPADIIFDEGPPLSIEHGKGIGDDALRNDKPIEALESYWKVLRNPNNEIVALSLTCLSNLALVKLKAGDPKSALHAAAFALAIDPAHENARFRYDDALARLGGCISDFGDMPETHPSITAGEEQSAYTPLELKNKGNDLFNDGDYDAAASMYVLALRHPKVCILGNLLSNMSNAYAQLRMWHMVIITSPMAFLFNPSLRSNNHMRYIVAVAQLRLGNVDRGLSMHTDSDLIDRVQRVRREQQGQYDFTRYARDSGPTPESDFVGPIKVAFIDDDKGRGLVATRDIKRGELILAARAISSADHGEMSAIVTYGMTLVQHHEIEMCEQLKAKTALPGGGAVLRDLSILCAPHVCDIAGHANTSFMSQPFQVPDTSYGFDLGRTLDVIAQNAFGLDDSLMKATGLFLWPSLMNHSDSANTFRRNIGDFVWFWASADIKESEEVTTMYYDVYEATSDPSHWNISSPAQLSPDAAAIKRRLDELVP